MIMLELLKAIITGNVFSTSLSGFMEDWQNIKNNDNEKKENIDDIKNIALKMYQMGFDDLMIKNFIIENGYDVEIRYGEKEFSRRFVIADDKDIVVKHDYGIFKIPYYNNDIDYNVSDNDFYLFVLIHNRILLVNEFMKPFIITISFSDNIMLPLLNVKIMANGTVYDIMYNSSNGMVIAKDIDDDFISEDDFIIYVVSKIAFDYKLDTEIVYKRNWFRKQYLKETYKSMINEYRLSWFDNEEDFYNTSVKFITSLYAI